MLVNCILCQSSQPNTSAYRIVERVFDRLQPLTVLDPLLLTEFVYICPRLELPYLFLQIPTFVSTAWLASVTRDSKSLDRSEVAFTER